MTLEFSNTTPLPAKIYANEGVAQMLFFESDEVCETSYKDRGGNKGQRGVTCRGRRCGLRLRDPPLPPPLSSPPPPPPPSSFPDGRDAAVPVEYDMPVVLAGARAVLVPNLERAETRHRQAELAALDGGFGRASFSSIPLRRDSR